MNFEQSHNEPLPAVEAQKVHPKERMNERVLIQHALIARSPGGAADWAMRHAATFGKLFDNDQEFGESIKAAHMEEDAAKRQEMLRAIQDKLDSEPSEHSA